MSRTHIPLKTQLAAALLQIPGDHVGYPAVAREEAKKMTADQIVSRFDLDHWPVPKAEGGSDEPHNLHWRLRAEHREKTAKQDIPQIAKGKRLRRSEAEHHARMRAKLLAPAEREDKPRRSAWPQGRKIPSRVFERRRT